jgi:catechol 2,3-dioxygenase-like lactoylglutathione lyase family enzyme
MFDQHGKNASRLSSRAQRRICFSLFLSVFLSTLTCAQEPRRPRILGIASVRVLVTDMAAAKAFYSKLLPEDQPCIWCGQPRRVTYSINSYQFVELSQFFAPPSAPPSLPSNVIREIVFATDNLGTMQQYLSAHKLILADPLLPSIEVLSPGAKSKSDKNNQLNTNEKVDLTILSVIDPEGHRIGFVQLPSEAFPNRGDPHPKRLIHAGIVVHDRAAEDKFYKDILGFHVYWHGGMKDGEDNWVDMQVPDGTDWIEYMLKVPENASHKTLGVMNHFAIGVTDIEAATYNAEKSGILAGQEPKIGRDGKWQLNLYDPDETRIELMEFKPTQEPCCAPYTGPHPGPK